MVRVPVPEWAPAFARGEVEFQMVADKYGDTITPAERETLLERRADILALVHAQVEQYANDMSAPPGEDWFPKQARFTGEYYIGEESYHKLVGASGCQIRVEARCLAHGKDRPRDYLGLDVWLRFDPDSGRIWVHRNTDSKVI
jgi:hypothetical protein